MTKRVFVAAAALTLSLAAGSATSAQQSRPTSYGEEIYQAPQFGAPNNPYSDYPAAEVQAVPAAKARAAIAHMEMLRAQATLNRGTRAAMRTFAKSEDMSKATSDQDQAYKQYQAARDKALQPLQNDSRYLAAHEMKQRLGQKIVETHEQAEVDPHKPVLHEIIAMAGLKLRYATEMSAKETEALRNSAEVKDARERLVSASGRVSGLRKQFDDDVREDPDLIAARKAVFDTKIAHIASQSYLAAVKEARGIALDYAYFVRRYNPYRVMGYDPYGFNRYYSGYYYGNGYYGNGYRY